MSTYAVAEPARNSAPLPAKPPAARGALWRGTMKWTRTLHIYISLLGLALFMFFSVTGFLLNHGCFGLAEPRTASSRATLPAEVFRAPDKAAFIQRLRASLGITLPLTQFSIRGGDAEATFAGPGIRVQAFINAASREAEVMTETRGWAGKIADLHKGSSGGALWAAMLDASSLLLAVCAITGLVLLLALPKRRVAGLIAVVSGAALAGLAYLMCVPR